MLRALRDSQLLRRQAFLEFDLKAMFAGERFADFALLYRLIQRSRLPHGDADSKSCLLEQYYQHTIEQGGRVRDKLREGVENAIGLLGNALLSRPANDPLLQSVESGTVTANRLYQEILRLIYRLLFLMVTEERNLLSPNSVYREYYSIARLRSLCERRLARNNHTDLWTGLQSTFRLFHSEQYGQVLDVPPLNGDLFDLNRTADLNFAVITNRAFLDALWCLSTYHEQPSSPPRHINYAALDVEELGSVYESLLDLQPIFGSENGKVSFRLVAGTERKTTGSYYTPPELVDELVKSALVPVLEDRLKQGRTAEEKAHKLLEITVCDPACGSGHFLLAAARRLARELAKIRGGEDEPSPAQYRTALRDTIAHCIYGVDKNPLAVELCRVALWLESHAAGKPLSFLDHRILCGDSLVGVLDLAALDKGIPDDAFKPVTGDDREVAKDAKKHNKLARERLSREQAFAFTPVADVAAMAAARRNLTDLPDDSPEVIRQKRALFDQFHSGSGYSKDKSAADFWTYAFFSDLTEANVAHGISTTEAVRAALEGGQPDVQLLASANVEADRLGFFHWPLEFPEVFARGGFDVLLCNPPWEMLQLEEQQFFAAKDLAIANAPNAAARKRMIQSLPRTNPILWRDYTQVMHDTDALRKYLREAGRYPLTSGGRGNSSSLFGESFTSLVGKGGRVGAVLPTGIATDDSNKRFFEWIVADHRLVSLIGFENEAFIFPAVHHAFRFCLLTLSGSPAVGISPEFMFFARHYDQLSDTRRRFSLTAGDLQQVNPNTRTCPVFRTLADAQLALRIYRTFPVLMEESDSGNTWGITFKQGLFNMSTDSHLFRTREPLEAEGYRLSGNRFVKAGGPVYYPLYEAKMVHAFDHRPGTFESVREHLPIALPPLSDAEKMDPAALSLPTIENFDYCEYCEYCEYVVF